jgi:hypothetical protein
LTAWPWWKRSKLEELRTVPETKNQGLVIDACADGDELGHQ